MSLSSLPALSIAAYMITLLPIYHHFFTLTLQHDRFDHHPPNFLFNLVSELHLLLGASDLLDHESGTLCLITSNLLPLLSSLSDPNSKINSSLQKLNNWPPCELSAHLIRSYIWFCAHYKFTSLHYIKLLCIWSFYLSFSWKVKNLSLSLFFSSFICIHLGSLRNDFSSIDQASLFHMIFNLLFFTLTLSFMPICILFDLCLWIITH